MNLRPLLLLLAVLACAGCSSPPPPPPDAGPPVLFCEVRADCDLEGQVCTQGNFCADCETSGQCRQKEECRIDAEAGTQRCALRAGWGTDCEKNAQCSAGQFCVQGLCKDSSQVQQCPTGVASECPANMRCNPVNFVCEEDLGCSENADCSPGEVCNTGSHACVPRCTPETQAEVCLGGEKCVNERCVQCETHAECGIGLFCDAAGRCSAEERCYLDKDCKVPLICHKPTGQCVDKPPPCVSDENCAPDQKCNVGTGKCVPRACQPDRFEPNDSAEAARQVAVNVSHTGLTLCEGDVDYYAFNLSRGDQLGVLVEADPFAENTFTTVVQDSEGRTLASGRLLASYVAASPDTYYAAISSTDLFQLYDVRFLMTRGVPCDDDGWEPNDLPGQATPINSAGMIDGAICPQDRDHFAVAVPAGKGVKLSLVGYSSSGGLLMLCAFEGGTQLDCSDDPGTPLVQASSAQVGGKTVLVRVSAPDERTANTYTLKVELP
jgi:hypothetical protein